jgi:hypothetical protein
MSDLFQCLLLFVQSFLLFCLSSLSVLSVNHSTSPLLVFHPLMHELVLYVLSSVFPPLSYELVSGLAFSCARLVHRVSFRIAMLFPSEQILGYFDVLLTLRKENVMLSVVKGPAMWSSVRQALRALTVRSAGLKEILLLAFLRGRSSLVQLYYVCLKRLPALVP